MAIRQVGDDRNARLRLVRGVEGQVVSVWKRIGHWIANALSITMAVIAAPIVFGVALAFASYCLARDAFKGKG